MLDFNFIIVNKVIKEKDNRLTSKEEGIKISDIKSFREWFKTEAEKIAFKEDMTILYMRDIDEDGKQVIKAVKILEPKKKFQERVGTIKFHEKENIVNKG